MLCALLCHGYWFVIYLAIHVFKYQVLDMNTVDFGWSFYCTLYLNTCMSLIYSLCTLHNRCHAHVAISSTPGTHMMKVQNEEWPSNLGRGSSKPEFMQPGYPLLPGADYQIVFHNLDLPFFHPSPQPSSTVHNFHFFCCPASFQCPLYHAIF